MEMQMEKKMKEELGKNIAEWEKKLNDGIF